MAPRRRRGASGGGRAGWWLVLLLVALGAAVFVGRTMDQPRAARPTPGASAPEPAQAGVRTATPLGQPRAAGGTAAQHATATATPHAVATATARVGATGTPRGGPTPSVHPAATGTAPNAVVRGTPAPAPAETAGSAGAAATQAAEHGPPAADHATPGSDHATPAADHATPGSDHATPAADHGMPAAGQVVAQDGHGLVALTFDAGADRGYAEDILDLLADEHVPASFGITGQWAKANPDLVRRMAADGHLVFNHTLDHRSFTGLSDGLGGLSAAQRRAELDQADAIIGPLIGQSTRPWYRLPYGDDDARVSADVGADGYARKVGWTVDSLGWRGASVADIVARCLRLAEPKAVYVFHVGRASRDSAALPTLLRGLRERGYGFGRVDAV